MHHNNHQTDQSAEQFIAKLRANLPADVSTIIRHDPASLNVINEWKNARLAQLKRAIIIEAASKVIKNNVEQYPHLSLHLEAHRVSNNRTVDQADLDDWITTKSLIAHQNGAKPVDHERALLASHTRDALKQQLAALQSIILHDEQTPSSTSNTASQQFFTTPTIKSTVSTLLGQSSAGSLHWPNVQLMDQRLKIISANDTVINSSLSPQMDRLQLASSWLAAKVDCLELKLSLQKIAASLSTESVQHPLPSQTKEAASLLARQKLTAALNERHTLLENELADLQANITRIRHVRTNSPHWNEFQLEWQAVKQAKSEKAWSMKQLGL